MPGSPLDFGAGILGDVGSALLNGAISGPVNDFNSFMGKINQAVQSPLSALTRRVNSMSNPYARENVLSVMQTRGDPVQQFDWIGVVLNNDQGLPWYYIDGLTSPQLTMAAQQYHYNGLDKKMPASLQVADAELTLYTDVNAVSLTYANAWFRSTFRRDGFYSLPSKIKRDVAIFILDAKRQTVMDFRLVGCWPTGLNSMQLTGDSGILQTTLSLSVDDVFTSVDSDLSQAAQRIGSLFPSITQGIGTAAGGLLGGILGR